MLPPYEVFLNRLDAVRTAVATACAEAGRDPATVKILPVTKNHPPEAAAFVARAGLGSVGENRVQEARDKKLALASTSWRWEVIGHLQSKKAKLAVSVFDRVQSVESVKLLDLLDRAAAESNRVLPVLIQVNAGRDPAKFGCELEDAPAIVEHALGRAHLRLEGLMTIAPLSDDTGVVRRAFDTLRDCRDALALRLGVALPELSMGMTGDLREAVLAGSTQVRVGTALFGARESS
jgi:pyridoxal phosphate enzyme (YggS family)